MNQKKTIVAILIINYNGVSYLDDCLTSIFATRYTDIEQHVYIVDNASTDNSVDYIRSTWPQVKLTQASHNLGYAGGNNKGWEMIKKDIPEISFILLLNEDTIVKPNFLSPLVNYLQSNHNVGSVQPLILLHPDTHKINSLGNVIHYLGFGYSSFNNRDIDRVPIESHKINYSSGAAVLLRCEAIDTVGLFDDFMFMYLEDLDLGWKLLLAGWSNILVPESIVYHKYEFQRGMKLFYYFERNRLWILLKNYRLFTIIVIAPAWLLMELGLLIRSAVTGTFRLKLKAYLYFLNPQHILQLAHDRMIVQRYRKRSDAELMSEFSGLIEFQPLTDFFLTRIANPFFNTYFKIVKKITTW